MLRIRDLTLGYPVRNGFSRVLSHVSLDLHHGEIVGLLGESGSGKTTLALAVVRLLSPLARILSGSVHFRGQDVLGMSEGHLQSFRGSQVAMIFQEPELALNPFMRALEQVEEVIRAHRSVSRERRREEACSVLARVRLDRAPRLLSAYPHQLSGGERQRLVIAQAIACNPLLLIADEPTASMDPILQNEWINLLRDLRAHSGLAVLLITHDPAIAAALADRIVILHRGRIVEEGTTEQMRRPKHPYAQALLHAIPPPPGADRPRGRLPCVD